MPISANPQPSPWAQRTAPFRRLLARFTQPTHGLLAELDALDAWCARLIAPALPSAATLDSPFTGLQTPEGAGPSPFAAAPAAGGAAPPALHSRPQQGPLTPSISPADLQTESPAPLNAAPPTGARSLDAPAPAQTGAAAAGIVLPVRGKPAETSAAARAVRTSRPAETPAPDLPGARLLRAGDLAPAAADAAQPRPNLAGSLVDAPPAVAPRPDSAAGVTANDVSGSDLGGSDRMAAAGLRLLVMLTDALYARASTAAPLPSAGAPHHPTGASVPWRAESLPSSALTATSEAALSFVDSGVQPAPFRPAAPGTPALPASQPVTPDMPWPQPAPLASPFTMPLDADLLADLVNEALLEQARRHGANLP
ncbi:MAG: hypothetical protein IT329_13750 [Caldilineaceae bacterium]|nr:hypothetical protein [Caldilineaceae bacterium]